MRMNQHSFLPSLTLAILLAANTSVVAQQTVVGHKFVDDTHGHTLKIQEWTDGFLRSKYLVTTPGETTGRWQWWFAQNGSANSGPNEAGRRTSNQEWCRVRYLYGDDVRIPECHGRYIYSSHLIRGLDGTHYELWFSPDSLTYFKIRNQETGLWYAHDGSTNNGHAGTTKEDWCRVIFYHMFGIIKLPEECKDTQTRIVNAVAGLLGSTQKERDEIQQKELADVARMLRLPPDGAKNAAVERTGKAQSFSDPTKAAEFGKNVGLGTAGGGAEEAFAKKYELKVGKLRYDQQSYTFRTGGPKASRWMADSLSEGSKLGKGGQFVSGLGVGIAVDYGVDAIKNAAGWKAKDANAGAIAAEAITTTVASSALTTAVLAVAGASFNPITAGVGLLIAGGIAAGEEIAKASKDTGIRLEAGYGAMPNYTRDLNGISSKTFAPTLMDGSYVWKQCASENGRCDFGGTRTVRFGDETKFVEKVATGGIDCNVASFPSDPLPGQAKICKVPRYGVDYSPFMRKAGTPQVYFQYSDTEYCQVQNGEQLAAFDATTLVADVSTLELKGKNQGLCPFPNGLYRLKSDHTVYYLTGAAINAAEKMPQRQMGRDACGVQNMDQLRRIGSPSAIKVLPDGTDMGRGRGHAAPCKI